MSAPPMHLGASVAPVIAEPAELSGLSAYPAPTSAPRFNVLLLCDDSHPANVVQDHIEAFRLYSRNYVYTYNPIGDRPGLIDFVENFDALIIHYSICIFNEYFLPRRAEEQIRRFTGLKLQFIQDEYRSINRVTDKMIRLGVHVLFSALRPDNIRKVYARDELSGVLKFGTLSGYVPEYLQRLSPPPIRERPLHITYRAREIPFWLGQLSRQKHELAEKFPTIADRHGLRHDISNKETERLYGRDWVSFLCSGKAMLGTEGGSSIFDFDDQIQNRTNEYLKQNPNATFEMVHRDVLAAVDGNIVHRALTPRIFEAAALKCALVLTRGEYAGILQPWRHYIPLEADLSNADRVAELLKDDAYLQELADRTYDEIIVSGRYSMRKFIEGVDATIALAAERFAEGGWTAPLPPATRHPTRKMSFLRVRLAVAWKDLWYPFTRERRQARFWNVLALADKVALLTRARRILAKLPGPIRKRVRSVVLWMGGVR